MTRYRTALPVDAWLLDGLLAIIVKGSVQDDSLFGALIIGLQTAPHFELVKFCLFFNKRMTGVIAVDDCLVLLPRLQHSL